jgi:thymidylate synthase
MFEVERDYLSLVADTLQFGTLENNDRTGVGTYIYPGGAILKHSFATGFPLLTTKRIAYKTMATELEGFIKGVTDKTWYQDRKCRIWDEWSNSKTRPPGRSQEAWHDLGPIYGAQWRAFNGDVFQDQLRDVINALENRSTSRRLLVTAWNPLQLDQMALPPCHFAWQVKVRGDHLDLDWYQRSVDVMLGLPFNLASYGLLLQLLAYQFGFEPGVLTGHLGHVHIYQNHREGAETILARQPFPLPQLDIQPSFETTYDFNAQTDFVVRDYKHHPTVKMEVAV